MEHITTISRTLPETCSVLLATGQVCLTLSRTPRWHKGDAGTHPGIQARDGVQAVIQVSCWTTEQCDEN